MKYIRLNLLSGNIEKGNYTTGKFVNDYLDEPLANKYLNDYLDKFGCVQMYERPTDSKYLIIASIIQGRNYDWYTTPNLKNKLFPFYDDIHNKKALLLFNNITDASGILPGYNIRNISKTDRTIKLNPSFNDKNVRDHLKKILEFFDVSSSSIIYVDTNYKIDSFFKKHNLNGFFFNIWERFYEPLNNSIIENIKNRKLRNKKFLFLGGRSLPHRLQFVNELLKIPNFQNESYLSMGSSGKLIDFFTKEYKLMKSIVLDIANVHSINESDASKINIDFFNDSYINIIPSTRFYTQHYHLEFTEKFFKPIITMNPFIILGEPQTLKMLHELGYKTFNNWIDESYDNTLDDRERFIKVLNEVKRLNEFTLEQLNDMYLEMMPVLEHNQQLQASKYKEKDYTLYNQIKTKFDQL